MADEISVEVSDVGYVEVVDAPAEAGLVVETGPPDIPGFLAERGYGAATGTDAGPAPTTAGDDQPTAPEAAAKAEGKRIRQDLIDAGIIKPAPAEPKVETKPDAEKAERPRPVETAAEVHERDAKAEAQERRAKTPEEVEAWRKKLAELEAKDDEFRAKKGEEEKPKAKAEAEKPKAEKTSWRQRLKAGAQKTGSGLRKAASGVSKGLRKVSGGLRKSTTPKTTTPPPVKGTPLKGGSPKPQTTAKPTGLSAARKLGQSLGNLAGAPRRLAQGLREALPKPAPKPAERPAQQSPRNPGPGAVHNLGQALGNLAGAPRRLAEGLKQALPKAQTKEEPPGKPGDEPGSRPNGPGQLPGGGGGVTSPSINIGRAAMVVLLVASVGFLTAGSIASGTQAAGGIKLTPTLVVSALLAAIAAVLFLFRR